MDLESRILKLEDMVGITDEKPPLIRIDVMDCRKGSTDPGTPGIAIVPGKIRGPSGVTLTRAEDEDPDIFLKRCNAKYSEIYG